MGDAKRRGSFEQRKATAIARQKIEAEQQMVRKKEIDATKTPEQKLGGNQIMMELMMLACELRPASSSCEIRPAA